MHKQLQTQGSLLMFSFVCFDSKDMNCSRAALLYLLLCNYCLTVMGKQESKIRVKAAGMSSMVLPLICFNQHPLIYEALTKYFFSSHSSFQAST